MASIRTSIILVSIDFMIAIFRVFVKRTLQEARLCLFGRTGLRRSVAAECFLVRYYGIVFPKFQTFGNLLARAHSQKACWLEPVITR